MADFRNTYHFLPVSSLLGPSIPVQDLPSSPHVRHDFYAPATSSGRILCRLTTVSPVVVGNQQERQGDAIANVNPFLLDGQPAIPASTLRGAVASLAEGISNSALRVLDDKKYSYRKGREPGEALSAIGMIWEQAPGDLQLRPLSMPTLDVIHGVATLPARFRNFFPRPLMKAYFGDVNTITNPDFPSRFATSYCQPAGGSRPISPRYQARIPGIRWLNPDQRTIAVPVPGTPGWKTKEIDGRRFFLGWELGDDPGASLLPWTFGQAKNPGFTTGYIRALGCWGPARKDMIPLGGPAKKHEFFLPEAHPQILIPIPQAVIERFHSLADERTAENPILPLEPAGTPRNRSGNPRDHRFRLKHGDMVYFDVDEQEQVSVLSLSSIWRGRVEDQAGAPAGAHAFFRAVHPELLPLHPGREKLTIAELMFGVTEEIAGGKKRPGHTQALALASRIRFADALPPGPIENPFLPPVPLRILSSPKTPPALCFTPDNNGQGGFVEKKHWTPSHTPAPGKPRQGQIPQGRKLYLHHYLAPGAEPWRTGDPADAANQKVQVTPLRPDVELYFHVDFDNLSPQELGLLLHALAPAPGFHHKLGLGKPLGLGTVRLDIQGLFLVNRQSRYTAEGLASHRYEAPPAGQDPLPDSAQWPLRYARERHAACAGRVFCDWEQRKRGFIVSSGRVRNALELLGALPGAADPPVSIPLVDGQNPEVETFQWAVANDRGIVNRPRNRRIVSRRQYLEPIRKSPSSIPTLSTYTWEPIKDA